MGLRGYLVKRIAFSIFLLWLVVTLNFIIFSAQKGSPFAHLQEISGREGAETRERLLEAYGINDPWPIKYVKYLRNMFTFGIVYPYFGISIGTRNYIAQDMAPKLIITVFLLGSALIGRILIGIPLGILAAAKRVGKTDVAVVGSALFTWGLPTFFIQLLAIFLVGTVLRDRFGIRTFATTWGTILVSRQDAPLQWWSACLWQLTLPILTLVLMAFGSWVIYTRNMLIDALTADYVATARAKGLSERTVLYKHAFKSILPPISTMITLSIPGVVTGAIITETIFGIEGIGKWYIGSMSLAAADYGVAQAVLFIFATLVIISNLLSDILYGILDPRIRVGSRR
jgi:peptide/nickel transport system permease protein